MSKRSKRVLFAGLLLAGMALALFAPAAFADGGPLILCPPKSKTCVCTLPHC